MVGKEKFVWAELHKIMSTMISEAISQIHLNSRENKVTDNPHQGQGAQSIILLGRTTISFRLPESIIALNIDLDEIDRSKDKKTGGSATKSRLSFVKRLEGWTIECLQCKNCLHFETIYRHVEAKKQFRSVAGALKYVCYGEYSSIQDEIDIYIGEQWTTINLAADIHKKLVKVFRDIISEAVSPLAKRPDDFAYEANETAIVPYAGRSNRKKMRHVLLGELHTSFVLPEESEVQCLAIDQIETPKDFKKMYIAPNIRGFCFKERSSGWIIERTRRSNGVCEMFYYHSGWGKTLRSMTEVANFILYEVFPVPPNSRKEYKMLKPEKGLYVAKAATARLLTEEEEVEDAYAVNFLRQSLHNMLKLVCSHKSTAGTDAGNRSQWKKDEHKKEKDTEEELPSCYEPLPSLQCQAQPADSGGANDEGLKAILEGMQGGEGNIKRDNRKETTKDVEDSSKTVRLNEEQNNIVNIHNDKVEERLLPLSEVCKFSSASEMIELFCEFEKQQQQQPKP